MLLWSRGEKWRQGERKSKDTIYMFYTCFVSASPTHIDWLRKEIYRRISVRGHVTLDGRRILQQLKYAKADSLKLLRRMYHTRTHTM